MSNLGLSVRSQPMDFQSIVVEYILPMFSSTELDKSYCRQLKVSGVFKHEFRRNEPDTNLQYLTPIPNLSFFESFDGKMTLFPETINELVLLKCTLDKQPQTGILLPPSTLPIDITPSGSYETNVNFEFLLLSDVLNIIKYKFKHIPSKFQDVDIDVYYQSGLLKIHKKEVSASSIPNATVEKLEFLSKIKMDNFKETVPVLLDIIINNTKIYIGENQESINSRLFNKYEKNIWFKKANIVLSSNSNSKLEEDYSHLFIASIFKLMRENPEGMNISNDSIYIDLENTRNGKGWGKDIIKDWISGATKEIEKYN